MAVLSLHVHCDTGAPLRAVRLMQGIGKLQRQSVLALQQPQQWKKQPTAKENTHGQPAILFALCCNSPVGTCWAVPLHAGVPPWCVRHASLCWRCSRCVYLPAHISITGSFINQAPRSFKGSRATTACISQGHTHMYYHPTLVGSGQCNCIQLQCQPQIKCQYCEYGQELPTPTCVAVRTGLLMQPHTPQKHAVWACTIPYYA